MDMSKPIVDEFLVFLWNLGIGRDDDLLPSADECYALYVRSVADKRKVDE